MVCEIPDRVMIYNENGINKMKAHKGVNSEKSLIYSSYEHVFYA